MTAKRLRIHQIKRIEQILEKGPYTSQSQLNKILKSQYRGIFITDKEQGILFQYIPQNLHKTTEDFVKSHNQSISESQNSKERKKIRNLDSHNPNRKETITSSNIYQIGQRIICKASDFRFSVGIIKYDSLSLRTVRVEEAFTPKVLSAIEETFTIVVETKAKFHFEPYTDLSKILSCCIAEKLRLEKYSKIKKGTSLLTLELTKSKEDILKRVSLLLSSNIDDLAYILNYYDEDNSMFKIWAPRIYDGVSYSTLCKFIKDPSTITPGQLHFSAYLRNAFKICREYHIQDIGLSKFEAFINEQVIKIKEYIESVRTHFFKDLFENAKGKIQEHLKYNYSIKFSSSNCSIIEDRLVIDRENVNIESEEYISELDSEIKSFENVLNYDASFFKEELKELLYKEYDEILNQMFVNDSLIIPTGISHNNLRILLSTETEMTVPFSKTPTIHVCVPYTRSNIEYVKGNMSNRFLTKGGGYDVPLSSLLSMALNNPEILYGELFTFTSQTHDLWIKFINSTFGEKPEGEFCFDSYASLRNPFKHFAPAFRLNDKYFEEKIPEKHRYIQRLLSTKNPIYLIYEDYNHFSDEWSGKSNFVTYLELSDYSIRIIPTDPQSTIHHLSYFPPVYKELGCKV